MSGQFEKWIQALQQKNVNLSEYQDYLLTLESNYAPLTQTLKQRQIDLIAYHHYLTQPLSPLAKTESTILSQQHREKIEYLGELLLKRGKVTLDDLNRLLRESSIEQLAPERVLANLLKQRKIQVDDFTELLKKSGTDLNEKSGEFHLREKKGKFEFYLGNGNGTEFIGEYELKEELGRGGMGIVYKAYHRGLNQYVALKVMIAGDGANEKTLKRFQREMKVLAKLSHPRIVKIIDAGEENGKYYLVMEYVAGKSLEQVRDKLSLREKVTTLIQILSAISHAHRENILHRDLKLENILLTEIGEAKVLDFGLAKELGTERESLRLTQSGVLLGTLHYMAPEQIQGDSSKISERTDLYALGVCLYRLLTGRYPYHANTLQSLCIAIEKGDARSPREWNREINRDLEAIVLKSIEKEPSKRYFCADDFIRDLQNFLDGYPVSATLLQTRTQHLKKWSRKYRKHLMGTLMLMASFIVLVSGTLWLSARERNHQLEQLYVTAKQHQESASNEKISSEKTKLLWAGLSLINERLSLGKEKKAEVLKWKIGNDLLAIAYSNQSYQWAEYLVEDLKQLVFISSLEKKDLALELTTKKAQKLKYHQTRLEYWKKQLLTRKRTETERKDIVYEILQMEEDAILNEIQELLEKGISTVLQEDQETLEGDAYKTFIEIAGRYRKEMFIPVLKNGIQQLCAKINQNPTGCSTTAQVSFQKIDTLVLYIQALAQYSLENELDELYEIRTQMSWSSLFLERTQSAYQKWLKKADWETLKIKTLQGENPWLKRGLLLVETQKWDEAIQEFSFKMQKDPQNPLFYFYRGAAYKGKGEFLKAINDYTQCIRLDPQMSNAYIHRGTTKYLQNDYSGAIDDFSEAIRIHPGLEDAYNNRGNARQQQGDLEGSLADYSKAIELNPHNTNAYNNRGTVRQKTKDYSGSIDDFTVVLRLNPKNADAYNNRGMSKKANGDLPGALADYNETIRLQPQYAKAYYNRGNTKQETGDQNGALQDYTEAIRLDPKYANAYTNRGNILQARGQFEEAIEDYTMAILSDPQYADAYSNRGTAKQSQGDIPGALSDYNECIRIHPDYADGYHNRGFLREATGDLQGAVRDYSEAIRFAPHDPANYNDRGNVRQSLGDQNGALQDYTQAIQIDPQMALAYFNRGLLHYEQQNIRKAKMDLFQFIQLTQQNQSQEILKAREQILAVFPELKGK